MAKAAAKVAEGAATAGGAEGAGEGGEACLGGNGSRLRLVSWAKIPPPPKGNLRARPFVLLADEAHYMQVCVWMM